MKKGTTIDETFVLKYPTMDFSIKVVICPQEILDSKYNVEVSRYTKACFFQDLHWLWVDPQYFNAGIVAHESIHAINVIFDKKGVEITMENDEILAYYVEDMVNKILKKYEQKSNKRK